MSIVPVGSAGRPSYRRTSSSTGGFTIVEVLVVVVIIGLLVAIVMPSLTRAGELAADVRCKSNLRQIWQIMHADALAMPAPSGWVNQVRGKGGSGVLRCPKHTLEGVDVGGSIITGGNVKEVGPPVSARFNDQPESNTIIYTYTEREGYALPVSVQVDISAPGRYGSQSSLTRNVIPAGTIVDCQYLFFDPVGSQDAYSSGSITMGAEILGIICMDSSLNATDVVLGRPGTKYHTGEGDRGYEMGEDVVSLESDMRTYTIHNYHSTYPGENARILTQPGGQASYGMNKQVPTIDARPGQLMLLDYDRVIADPDVHGAGGRMSFLAPRHLNRSNGVFVHGGVESLTDEQLRPDSPLWEP